MKGGLAGKGSELEFYVDTAPVRLSQRFLAHKWIHAGADNKKLCVELRLIILRCFNNEHLI